MSSSRRGFSTDRPWKLYLFAGLGACAGELVSQPIDLVKTRMQLQGQVVGGQRVTAFRYAHSFAAFFGVLRAEGVRRLYAGLPPALLRSLTYGSLRIGFYEPLKAALSSQFGGESTAHTLPLRALAGAVSGATAAALCAPADVLKIRLQSRAGGAGGAGGLWAEATAVVREGGARALWRGAAPTAARAAVVAATELALYEEARERITRARGPGGGGAGTHISAALLAGAAASMLSSPLDVVRARLMAAGGGARYGGVVGVLRAAEGARALCAGVPADFARRAPHTVANYLVLEHLRERWG